MFIRKAKYNALREKCIKMDIDLMMANDNIRLLRMGHMSTIKALLLLNKKTQNLAEIVKLLPTNKERKMVIAKTKDGTEITIGDVLDGEDLIPQVEEYQSARI